MNVCKFILKLCVDGRISNIICRSCCILFFDILCLEVNNVSNSINVFVVILVFLNNGCEFLLLKMFKFLVLFKLLEFNLLFWINDIFKFFGMWNDMFVFDVKVNFEIVVLLCFLKRLRKLLLLKVWEIFFNCV